MVWSNQNLRVFHGTLQRHETAVASRPSTALGSPLTDFGLGFYLTTQKQQAESWANQKVGKSASRETAAVIEYEIERDWLSTLDTLAFIIDEIDTGYWDFVSHCRAGPVYTPGFGGACADHARSGFKQHYDVVYGPVSIWDQKFIISGCDQISFHGPPGTLLNLSHVFTHLGAPTFV